MKAKKETVYKTSWAWVLQIIFIILKLTNVITWSWVWVLSPMWISLILCVICVIGILLLSKKSN